MDKVMKKRILKIIEGELDTKFTPMEEEYKELFFDEIYKVLDRHYVPYQVIERWYISHLICDSSHLNLTTLN